MLIEEKIFSVNYKDLHIREIQLLNAKANDYLNSKDNQVQSNIESTLVAEHSYLQQVIASVLETLTPREQEKLILRYGLNDGQYRSLEEVGQIFGVTREAIRQIEAKALRKLRHPSRSDKLKDFCEDEYSMHFNENYLNNTHKELSSTCYDEDYYMFNDIESLDEDIEHTEILEFFRKRKKR